MKRIAYLIEDCGVDWCNPQRCLHAFWNEADRGIILRADPNRRWRSTREVIVDDTVVRKEALAKLDGIDRLVLDLGAK